MNLKFTEVVEEALQKAVSLAQEKKHTEITDNHLLLSFLIPPEGYFSTTFKSLEFPYQDLIKELEKSLSTLPTFSGEAGQPRPSYSLQNRLQEAEKIAKEFKDE